MFGSDAPPYKPKVVKLPDGRVVKVDDLLQTGPTTEKRSAAAQELAEKIMSLEARIDQLGAIVIAMEDKYARLEEAVFPKPKDELLIRVVEKEDIGYAVQINDNTIAYIAANDNGKFRIYFMDHVFRDAGLERRTFDDLESCADAVAESVRAKLRSQGINAEMAEDQEDD